MKKIFPLILAILLFISGAAAQTARSWDPARTWVYFVGLLEWKDSESYPSFPQENRRDAVLLDVLRQSGVPEKQIMYLKDRQATTARVRETFPKFLAQAAPGDTVIVYFCGHGDRSEDNKKTYFVTWDANDKAPGWDVAALVGDIEHDFKGAEAILMADNCYSGGLADVVKKTGAASHISYAVMTSTPANSSSTGNWTFTESLIYAFRGDAYIDDDADGRVTFAELEANTSADMLFAEEQLTEFVYTNDFDRQGVVAPAAKSAAPRVGERVEAYSGGDYYRGFIRDAQNGKFLIRYYGFEEADDEWVTAAKIRHAAPKQYKVGAKVQVESEGKWYAARVLDVRGGAHYVAYDGYGSEWNEWVSSERVRVKR
ncbi:MAG: caspase family protein [Acidobacteria bacterium]|nr:caspase family protein [Acidobacteriota bacterium]